MTLRTLDLSLFTHGSGYDRQHFGSQLLGSLSQDGFVKLIGHGITDSAVYKLFEWVGPEQQPKIGRRKNHDEFAE